VSGGEAAIVDFGRGNLYSVARACAHVGLPARITSDPEAVASAPGVILPGVGAFGDAMAALRKRGLADALRDAASRDVPLLGVCLGIQLLMSESAEFGRHRGLGILEGDVIRFEPPSGPGPALKIPHTGWNRVRRAAPAGPADPWAGTLLEGQPDGEPFYFVHSFYVKPADPRVILSLTRYGPSEFCSSVARGNLFACQFHPERSGPSGLAVYRNFAARVAGRPGGGR
jgi:glutamine amidotransferase